MYRELYEKEQKWIDSLLAVDFKGKDILLKQISKAKVTYKQEYAYISIKFFLEGATELYPYQVRVPVEMRAFQKSSAPVVFLLHIINGIVDEVEIITADASLINADNIGLERIEYEINKEVQIL